MISKAHRWLLNLSKTVLDHPKISQKLPKKCRSSFYGKATCDLLWLSIHLQLIGALDNALIAFICKETTVWKLDIKIPKICNYFFTYFRPDLKLDTLSHTKTVTKPCLLVRNYLEGLYQGVPCSRGGGGKKICILLEGNYTTESIQTECGSGFERNNWRIDGFGEKMARIGGFVNPYSPSSLRECTQS